MLIGERESKFKRLKESERIKNKKRLKSFKINNKTT
jgi:hypothetical protein